MSKEAKSTIRSEFAHVVRVFFRHKLGMAGLVMLILFAGAAAFAPVVAPKDPYEMDLMSPFLPPGSPGYILGTDNYGRDILSRLIHGSRISLLIGIVVVSIATVIGSVLGLVAGYYGGFIDKTLVMNEESFGYPHNGGYHSLTLRLSKDDAKAFVELVEERYDGHPGLKDFSQHIRAQLH